MHVREQSRDRKIAKEQVRQTDSRADLNRVNARVLRIDYL